jgi:hypothetical protein
MKVELQIEFKTKYGGTLKEIVREDLRALKPGMNRLNIDRWFLSNSDNRTTVLG